GKVGSSIAQLQQAELDHLMPPARKQKCRFMNLQRIVGWSTELCDSTQTRRMRSARERQQKSVNTQV
ncbi:MAG: hypothetical protein ACKO3T_09980, partial [Planctomycetaceae bacterium]